MVFYYLSGVLTAKAMAYMKNDIRRMNEILSWQKQVQLKPMIKHEFTGATKQRCVFEGGEACEVDFATGEYRIDCER